LIDFASITGDDIVLVTVASSSAALSALQMAKAEGATVISQTRTAAKRDFMREAGADCVVVTDEEGLPGRGFTVGYDPIGGHFCGDLIAAAQPSSKIIVTTYDACRRSGFTCR
jgi:NADPH:quinone reductase-like Zn-dependent oxidoreductase